MRSKEILKFINREPNPDKQKSATELQSEINSLEIQKKDLKRQIERYTSRLLELQQANGRNFSQSSLEEINALKIKLETASETVNNITANIAAKKKVLPKTANRESNTRLSEIESEKRELRAAYREDFINLCVGINLESLLEKAERFNQLINEAKSIDSRYAATSSLHDCTKGITGNEVLANALRNVLEMTSRRRKTVSLAEV